MVRHLAPVYLMTSWPQLYADLDVRCVRPGTWLRTQAKNEARLDLQWHPEPRGLQSQRVAYDGHGSMLDSMMRSVGLQREEMTFDGPPVRPRGGRPYVLVRPATVRREWMAEARNPDPVYLARAAAALRGHFDVVSVADLQGGAEWLVGTAPAADETYHAGELNLEQLLELVAGAAGVIGGVGWLLPAAIAYRVPMLLLYGGWGHVNGPQHTIDRRMDAGLVEQVFPDRFCPCNDRAHRCDKTISNLDEHLERFTLRGLARAGAAVAA